MEEKQRINKYLAHRGVGSRREIDKLIEMNLVKVNGELASSGQKVDKNDKIEINGKLIEGYKEKKVYFMLNKPQGYISAVKDMREKTVVELIDVPERIYPVGRLDLNTEGLLILTNDGDLYNKIIHPRAEIWKTYIAKVWGRVTEEEIIKLQEGIDLEDGVTLPAKVNLQRAYDNSSWVEISIREGRNRQVRRMLKAIGHHVIYLKREKLGELTVEGLEVGQYRELYQEELDYIFSL
ncbi:MAG: rRNA pseudouridine synthase [Fusobacteriaceae bacterium]|nr:rRNA pseudouridine synthase [Fusobacteriaceae bacterium]MBN2837976.1 rRNA pseudouridine synthase [Fusobacteriaceae bacterium]